MILHHTLINDINYKKNKYYSFEVLYMIQALTFNFT